MLNKLKPIILCIITFFLAVPTISLSEEACVVVQPQAQSPYKKKAKIAAVVAGASFVVMNVLVGGLARGAQYLMLRNKIYEVAQAKYEHDHSDKEAHSLEMLRKYIEGNKEPEKQEPNDPEKLYNQKISEETKQHFNHDVDFLVKAVGFPAVMSFLTMVISTGVSIHYLRKHFKEKKKLTPKTS